MVRVRVRLEKMSFELRIGFSVFDRRRLFGRVGMELVVQTGRKSCGSMRRWSQLFRKCAATFVKVGTAHFFLKTLKGYHFLNRKALSCFCNFL